ncbi:MAG: hypothetical protein Q9215_004741, partial [Flavoplaca cf. flavocitrina]
PGGFLQWDEIDVGAYRSQSSDAAVPAKASEQLIGYFLQYMRHLTLDSDWVSHLPTHLTPQGFEIIEWTKLQDHDATYKLETDDHLMVLEDQLPNIAVFMAEKAGRPCAEARQDLERLFRAVARETERGVDLRMDCTGRASPNNPSMKDDVASIRTAIAQTVEQDEKDVVLVLHSAGAFLGCMAIEGLSIKERSRQGKQGGVRKNRLLKWGGMGGGFLAWTFAFL